MRVAMLAFLVALSATAFSKGSDMAWQKMSFFNDGQMQEPVWYNTETGETSQWDPTPSGQYTYAPDYSTEGQSNRMAVDAVTGRPAAPGEADEFFRNQTINQLKQVIGSHTDPYRQAQALLNSPGGWAALHYALQHGLVQNMPEFGDIIAKGQASQDSEGPGGLGALFSGDNILRTLSDPLNVEGTVKGVRDRLEDGNWVDPLGVGSSYSGKDETLPIDYAMQGRVADTDWRDVGRMYGRMAASIGAAAAMGGGQPATEAGGTAPSGTAPGGTAPVDPSGAAADPSIADRYSQLAQANQGTQLDVMAGRPSSFQVAQANTGITSDVTAGLQGGGSGVDVAQLWDAPLLDPGMPAPQPNFRLPSGELAYAPKGYSGPGQFTDGQGGAPQQSDPNNPDAVPAPQPKSTPGSSSTTLRDTVGGVTGGVTLTEALQGAAAGAAVASMLDGDSGAGDSEALAEEMAQTEAERQAQIEASMAAVNSAFSGFDDNYFRSVSDAYKQYAMPQFAEQSANARRRLPMQVPHVQSSAYLRKQSELESDILRGEADIGNNAITESLRRRGEVDMTKGELLGLASSGAPTESVAQQASSRAGILSAPPTFSPIADQFAKWSDNALNATLASRRTPQAQVSRPIMFSHSPSRSARNIS